MGKTAQSLASTVFGSHDRNTGKKKSGEQNRTALAITYSCGNKSQDKKLTFLS